MKNWYSPFNLKKDLYQKFDSFGYKRIYDKNLIKEDTIIVYTSPDRVLFEEEKSSLNNYGESIFEKYNIIKNFFKKNIIVSEVYFLQLSSREIDAFLNKKIFEFPKKTKKKLTINKEVSLICKEFLIRYPKILYIYNDLELVNRLIISDLDLNIIERLNNDINIEDTLDYIFKLKSNIAILKNKTEELNLEKLTVDKCKLKISELERKINSQKIEHEHFISEKEEEFSKSLSIQEDKYNNKLEECNNNFEDLLNLNEQKFSEELKNQANNYKSQLLLKDKDYKSALSLIKLQDELASKSAQILQKTLSKKYL